MMLKWIKPNGKELEINDSPGNIAEAKALGWKPVEVDKPSPTPAAPGAARTGQKPQKGKGS